MPAWFKQVSKKAGLPPGTLVYVGESSAQETTLTVIRYNSETVSESLLKSSELPLALEADEFYWINVEGLVDIEKITYVGSCFNIHPLILEDILNTERRPKIDVFADQIVVFFRMLMFNELKQEVESEQVSLVLKKEGVITFQEKPGDVFEPIRQRIRVQKGRVRQAASDYLTYALIDAVVDQYFIILEKIGERIDYIEEQVISSQGMQSDLLQKMYQLKKQVFFLKKSIWPLREVIENLIKEESPLIAHSIRLYFRDVYEHVIHILDTTELYRESINSIHDTYYSQVSQRMNETMKVLTVIATIFIPLTFLAGVYGMNFKWMPELQWKWAYPAIWVVMLSTALVMVIFFKKKKWF